MSAPQLEPRYLILKVKDEDPDVVDNILGHLYHEGIEHLLVEGVVIEKGWPEYKPTVDFLMKRVGVPNE